MRGIKRPVKRLDDESLVDGRKRMTLNKDGNWVFPYTNNRKADFTICAMIYIARSSTKAKENGAGLQAHWMCFEPPLTAMFWGHGIPYMRSKVSGQRPGDQVKSALCRLECRNQLGSGLVMINPWLRTKL